MGRGETAPLRTRQFLEIAEDSDGSMTLMCKLTNPGFFLFHLALTHPRRQYFSALLIPGPGTRQLGTTPKAQSPQNYTN